MAGLSAWRRPLVNLAQGAQALLRPISGSISALPRAIKSSVAWPSGRRLLSTAVPAPAPSFVQDSTVAASAHVAASIGRAETGDPALQRRILIIYTGGTVGMRKTDGTWKPARGYLTERLEEMALTERLPKFTVLEYDPLLDSSDIIPADWIKMVKDIRDRYDQYDGFVILHGTDTMAYTCSALSFMLENLGKPVVMTGAQIPFIESFNDARRNIIVSMFIAASSGIPECMIFFDDVLLRGNRSCKVDAWGLEGFTSFNMHPLGSLQNKVKIFRELVLDRPMHVRKLPGDLGHDSLVPSKPLRAHTTLDTHIVVFKLIPGFADSVLDAMLEDPDVRGVIILAYGTGNAPGRKDGLLRMLKQAADRGVVIVILSQCMKGAVDMLHYETGRTLREAGVVSGHDMTTEAAVTKLAWLLGHQPPLELDEIKRRMSLNVVGELTPAESVQSTEFIFDSVSRPGRRNN